MAEAEYKALWKENLVLIFINACLVFIFGIGIMQSMEVVAECSMELFLSGVMFWGYFTLFLLR